MSPTTYASLDCVDRHTLVTCKPDTFKTMECLCPRGGDPRAGGVILQTYDEAFQLYMSGP